MAGATPERIQEVRAMENVVTPMPLYQSHKKVWALKIAAIEAANPPTIDELEKILLKHKPEVGGYFVQYSDGYKSFSPAKAFEEGYTRI